MSLPIEIVPAEAVPHSNWRDLIGIIASVSCAIHCAAMPFVIAYLPSLGLSFLADEAFHKWMFVVCMGIGLVAFVPGWRLHRRLIPVGIASVGLTFIGSAAFGLAGECCPTCEVDSVAATEGADADAGSTCCEHDCCAHDKTDVEEATVLPEPTDTVATPALAQASVFGSGFLAQLAPWITPVGGILLICAHLLNRRYGCRCGCCEAPTTAG